MRAEDFPFLIIRPPTDGSAVRRLLQKLDDGEAQAIVLARELGAELLIDEADGRAEATVLGLKIVGVIGLLIRAKQRGLVQAVCPLIEKVSSEIGFFVSPALIATVKQLTGE